MKKTFKPITSNLLRKNRETAALARLVFGGMCDRVNDDGTINVTVRSVDDRGNKTTDLMPNIRLVGADVPSVNDLVVLSNQGAGKVVCLGRLRTDSDPIEGIGNNRVLAHWHWSDTVIPSLTTRTGVDDDGTAAGFSLTVLTLPPSGRKITLDIYYDGKSMWTNPSDIPQPMKEDFDPDQGLYIYEFTEPVEIKKNKSLQGQIVDGAGARWMEMKVLSTSKKSTEATV